MEGNFYEFLEENSLNYNTNSVSKNQGNVDSEEKFSDSSCNKTGHWSKEEHHKFLEGMFLYGNDWKSVQNHIGTRSSTQARSHAQKFFQRMKKKLRWESCTSKNMSKEILFNLFKDSSRNKDIGEENKAKLMKIIGSFTDPPLKRSKKCKRVSDKSLSNSEEAKKTYFEIRKVHRENHKCNQKTKESIFEDSLSFKEIPQIYCDNDEQKISQTSSNYLNCIKENQNNHLLTIFPLNQQSVDKFKTSFIVFPNNSSNIPQKKINLLNFPPNKNHLEVPILNSKGKCIQKSSSLLQFLLDCKKQGISNLNVNLNKRQMNECEKININDKQMDSNFIRPEESILINNSPSVIKEIFDDNHEKHEEGGEHNPFNTNFDELKVKKKSDEDIQFNLDDNNNNINFENDMIFSNLKYD